MNCKFLSIGWMISLICSWAPLLDAALPIVPITISNDNSSLINSTSLNDTSLTDNQTSSSTILTPSNSSGNVSGPIPASAPSWMNASHLFTIELLLGTPLTYPTNDTASRVVRPILNGTISGLALNATILGGLAFTMVQATSPSSASSIASASFWGLSSNNQSLFITQTELRPKLSKPRLGRLTVGFGNGSKLSQTLIIGASRRSNLNSSSSSYLKPSNLTDLSTTIDAWGIL